MKNIFKIVACLAGGLVLFVIGLAFVYVDFSNATDLDTFIESKMSSVQAQGMAVAFIKDGEISWSKNYGYADAEVQKEISDETIFQIASVSKTVTGAAVMQLQERGLIDLDASINRYLPFEIKNPGFPDQKITVRMLLQHKSSLIDNDPVYRSTFTVFSGSPDPEMTLEELIRSYFLVGGDLYDAEENFSQKPPGDEMSYSNVAFGLLGFIVEQVTGLAFNVYCSENIFIPLGMQSAGWMSTDIDMENLAVQYDGGMRIKPYSVASYPDGALKLSVKDYAKFLMAMMNGGSYNSQRILNEATVRKMMPESRVGNLVWNNNVLGDYFIDVGNQYLQGHGGGDPGISTLAAFNPENGNAIIVFMNGAPSLISPSPFLLLEMLNYRSFFNRLAKEAGLY